MTRAFAQLFPELAWIEFSPDEFGRLLHSLERFGAHGSAAAGYLREHATRFGYFPQTRSGAGWTLHGNLTLPPGAALDNPRILAVVIHEVLHLRQPLLTRLSIQGELLGWQLEYQAYHDVTGNYYGEDDAPFPGTAVYWAELSRLSPLSHPHLARARVLMKQVSPRYRAHLLPLYPLFGEIRYALMRPFRNSGP